MKYRPRIIRGTVRNTGYPIDGHVLDFSQWAYDNYEYYHLYGWLGERTDEAVMRTMYQKETETGLCLYDTFEEFMKAWKKKKWGEKARKLQDSLCLTLEQVEVLEVIQEEHVEEIKLLWRHMMDAVGSVSVIRNFMGNVGRNRCNDSLYKALEDADTALQLQIPKKTVVKILDKDLKVGAVVFKAGTKVHYCPECLVAVSGSQNYCNICGQKLIW